MKFTLSLLAVLLLTFNGFAAKTYDIKYSIKNSYTGDALEGISIIVVNVKTNQQWKGETDKDGTIIFEGVDGAQISSVVQHSGGDYEARFVNFMNKKGRDREFEIVLYPTAEVLEAMWEMEDGQYGEIDEGTLSDSMNTNGLMCGCKERKFKDATFVGGTSEMQRFIAENVIYPTESINMNEQGRVYLSFVVESDGKVTHVKVERGISKHLDAEAIRLLRIMPLWIPGMCNGKKVRSIARLPISFRLN